MSLFFAWTFGAVAVLCLVATVSAAFRTRVLGHVPLRRHTYAIAFVWFLLGGVIAVKEGQLAEGRLRSLRYAGAALSLLVCASVAWDYHRARVIGNREQ